MKQPSLKRWQMLPFYAFAGKLKRFLSGVADKLHFCGRKCLLTLSFWRRSINASLEQPLIAPLFARLTPLPNRIAIPT
jgi:hypothetical protein